MVNRHRGEVELVVDGECYTLCLTLGALADLESRLEGEDLIGFADRLSRGEIRAGDLLVVLGAAARGGGVALSEDELARFMPAGGFAEAVEVVARLIGFAFGGTETDGGKKKLRESEGGDSPTEESPTGNSPKKSFPKKSFPQKSFPKKSFPQKNSPGVS